MADVSGGVNQVRTILFSCLKFVGVVLPATKAISWGKVTLRFKDEKQVPPPQVLYVEDHEDDDR